MRIKGGTRIRMGIKGELEKRLEESLNGRVWILQLSSRLNLEDSSSTYFNTTLGASRRFHFHGHGQNVTQHKPDFVFLFLLFSSTLFQSAQTGSWLRLNWRLEQRSRNENTPIRPRTTRFKRHRPSMLLDSLFSQTGAANRRCLRSGQARRPTENEKETHGWVGGRSRAEWSRITQV